MTGKITFMDIPHRRWRGKKDNPSLCEQEVFRKVMSRVGVLMREGRPVQMDHKIVCDGSKKVNSTYDTVTFIIGE